MKYLIGHIFQWIKFHEFKYNYARDQALTIFVDLFFLSITLKLVKYASVESIIHPIWYAVLQQVTLIC